MLKKNDNLASECKTLNDVRNGTFVRIKCLLGEHGTCHRLREMGFCEQACIMKVAENGALICQVKECNVIISKDLAKNGLVENID